MQTDADQAIQMGSKCNKASAKSTSWLLGPIEQLCEIWNCSSSLVLILGCSHCKGKNVVQWFTFYHIEQMYPISSSLEHLLCGEEGGTSNVRGLTWQNVSQTLQATHIQYECFTKSACVFKIFCWRYFSQTHPLNGAQVYKTLCSQESR